MIKVTIQHDDKMIEELTGVYAWGAVTESDGDCVESRAFLQGTLNPVTLEQNMENVIEALMKEATHEKPIVAATMLLLLSDELKEKAVKLLSNERPGGSTR